MLISFNNDYTPSEEEANQAKLAIKFLANLSNDVLCKPHLALKVDGSSKNIEIPHFAFELVVELLKQFSQGNSVTLIPNNKEFTTQEAADLLNVSRPYIIKLLESGAIKFRKVGAHRRIKVIDLMEYKKKSELERDEAFDELAKQAQELNLGYEK